MKEGEDEADDPEARMIGRAKQHVERAAEVARAHIREHPGGAAAVADFVPVEILASAHHEGKTEHRRDEQQPENRSMFGAHVPAGGKAPGLKCPTERET